MTEGATVVASGCYRRLTAATVRSSVTNKDKKTSRSEDGNRRKTQVDAKNKKKKGQDKVKAGM